MTSHEPRIAYHASHEQFAPGDLLAWAQLAEQAGVDAVFASDHLAPWSRRQGNSGFVWSWLGAAMQATRLPFGVVTTPGFRYHPVVLAQASATLASMFPGRLTVAVGSGEALNEGVVGPWPEKPEREAVLREATDVIQRLWVGETLSRRSPVYLDRAELHTLPQTPPALVAAALTARTARWLGSWAPGLITVADTPDGTAERVGAFREAGGRGRPVILKVQLASGATREEAVREASHQWREALVPTGLLADLATPEDFEHAAREISAERIAELIAPVTSVQELADHVRGFAGLGPHTVVLHDVARDQEGFLRMLGDGGLAAVREALRSG